MLECAFSFSYIGIGIRGNVIGYNNGSACLLIKTSLHFIPKQSSSLLSFHNLLISFFSQTAEKEDISINTQLQCLLPLILPS